MKKEKQIHLRALEMEDLDFLYEMENDESLWGVGCTNVPYSRQMLIDYLTNSTADIYADKQVRFVIEDERKEAIGFVDLTDFDPQHMRAELGIVIHKAHRRQGFASAAIRRLQQYARDVLHLHQIYAIVAVDNDSAARTLERLGFQGDRSLREWLYDGKSYKNAYFFQSFL